MLREFLPSSRTLVIVVLALFLTGLSAAAEEEPPMVLGACTPDRLDEEPFAEWYRSGHDGYAPNPATLRALRAAGFDGVELTLFFGTWCGDSRREVPRLLRLLEDAGFPADSLRLIGVDRGGKVHKQSPGGEERGREIYRVPTLVVERDGTELSRIVEFPVFSLERDLMAILSGESYEPNYASYPRIRRWLAEGLLADPNVSARGLAAQLQGSVASEGELSAVATVLISRGQVDEGIKLLETNCSLYWESARSHARLGEALLEAGRAEEAWPSIRRALRANDDPSRTEELLELAERVYSSESGAGSGSASDG